jgi:hypothetical protein
MGVVIVLTTLFLFTQVLRTDLSKPNENQNRRLLNPSTR